MGQAEDLSGKALHWFDVNDKEYYLHGDETLVKQIFSWCHDQFGPPQMGVTWAERASMFVFADESLAASFRIKWC
jgi:hypothetical protein